MKKTFAKIMNIAVFLFLLAASPAGAKDTVKITIGEWPPYLSQDLKYYGVVARIVSEAFALEDITVEYGFFPWKRALQLAKKNTQGWDGSAIWSISEERKTFFIFSDPVMEKINVFFHLKSTQFDWESIEDLKGLIIGATLGYNYGKVFQKAEEEGLIRTERIATDELSFRKLIRGRIPLFICNFTTGYGILNKLYDQDTVALFTNHPKPVAESYNSLILSKKKS